MSTNIQVEAWKCYWLTSKAAWTMRYFDIANKKTSAESASCIRPWSVHTSFILTACAKLWWFNGQRWALSHCRTLFLVFIFIGGCYLHFFVRALQGLFWFFGPYFREGTSPTRRWWWSIFNISVHVRKYHTEKKQNKKKSVFWVVFA